LSDVEPDAKAKSDHGLGLVSEVFLQTEHAIYIALGVVLAVTAIIALVGTVGSLWAAGTHWSGATAILLIIDRLLFVMMIAEILHTVRVSLRSGALTGEPFLIVGLIASIRRVLVITLESSQTGPGTTMEAGGGTMFRNSMIDLVVLAGLIIIMVVSIYLIRRSPAKPIDA
jgi:uncharacterized membrane protein (DUF373 family)